MDIYIYMIYVYIYIYPYSDSFHLHMYKQIQSYRDFILDYTTKLFVTMLYFFFILCYSISFYHVLPCYIILSNTMFDCLTLTYYIALNLCKTNILHTHLLLDLHMHIMHL